jgi:hypothetical protein
MTRQGVIEFFAVDNSVYRRYKEEGTRAVWSEVMALDPPDLRRVTKVQHESLERRYQRGRLSPYSANRLINP